MNGTRAILIVLVLLALYVTAIILASVLSGGMAG